MTSHRLEANSALIYFIDKFIRPRLIQQHIVEQLAKVLVGHTSGKIILSLHLVDMAVSKKLSDPFNNNLLNTDP